MQPETRAAQFDYDDDPPDKTDGGAASKKAVHEVYGPAPITEQKSGTGKGAGKAGAPAEEKPEEKSKAADKSLSEGWTNLKKDKDFSTESVDRYISSLDTAISARLKLIDPETLNNAKELAKMNGNSRAEKLALLSMTDPDLSADIQRARNIYTLLGYNATPQLFSLELRKQLAKDSLIADREKSLGHPLKDDEKIALTVNLDFDDEEALDRAIRANLKDKFPIPEPDKKQPVDYKDIAGQLEITENEAKELHARYIASFQEKKDDRDKGTFDALGDWASNHAGALTLTTLFTGTIATSVALRALLNRRRSAAAGQESGSSANRGEQARNDRPREERGRRSTRQEEQANREQARTEPNREGEGNARTRWWRRSGTNTGSGTDSSPPEGESQDRSRWSWRRSGTNTGSGTDSSPPEGESQTRSRWSWRRPGTNTGSSTDSRPEGESQTRSRWSWRRPGTNTGSGTDSRPEGEGNARSRWSFSQWWQRRGQAGNADQSEQRQTGPEGNNADQTRSEQGPVEQRTFDNIPSFLAGSVQNMQPSEAAKLMVRAVVIGRAEYDRHEGVTDRNVFEHIKTDLEDATRAIRAAGDVPQPVKDACDRVAQQIIAGDRDATVNIVRQQMSRLQSQFGDSRSGSLDRFVWSEVVNNPRVVESLAERVIEAEEAAREEGFVTDRNARVDITNQVIAELSRLSPVRAFLDSRTEEVIRDLIMAKVHQTVGEPDPSPANGGLGEMVPISARPSAGPDANAGRDEQIKADKERIKENRAANFLYGGLERGLLVNLPEGWDQVINDIKSDPLYRDGVAGETQRDALNDLIIECEQARDSGKYHSPAEYFASKLDRYSETRPRFVEESLKTLVDGAQVSQEMSTDAFIKVRDHLQACLQAQSQSLPADVVANIKTNIIDGLDWAISVSNSGAAPTQSPVDFINDLESTARSKSGEWESVAKSPWAMAQELQSPAAVERSLVENLKRYARSTQEPGQPPGDKIDLDGNSKTNRKRMAQYIEKGPLKARTDAGTGKPLAGQEAAHAALTKLAAALRKNSAGNSVEDILKAGIIADPIGKDGSPFIARQSGGTFEAFRRVGTEIEKYNPATKVYDKVQPDAVFEAVASSIEAAAKSTTDNSKAQELNIYAQELRTIGGDPKAEAFKELLGALEIPEEKAREKALEGVYAKGQSLVFVAKWLTGAGLSLSALLLNQGAAGKGRSMRAPNPGAFEGISF